MRWCGKKKIRKEKKRNNKSSGTQWDIVFTHLISLEKYWQDDFNYTLKEHQMRS
jgi:hypothetical protein